MVGLSTLDEGGSTNQIVERKNVSLTYFPPCRSPGEFSCVGTSSYCTMGLSVINITMEIVVFNLKPSPTADVY